MGTTNTNINTLSHSLYDKLISAAYECFECGKCTGTCPMAGIFPEHFNPHNLIKKLITDPDKVLEDICIWFCASCYRCNKICPQDVELPQIFLKLRKIAIEKKNADKLKKALEVIEEKIPFPASFLCVCLHPERISLNKAEVEKIINGIPYHKDKLPQVLKDNKVAVIGSGPAGLFVAIELMQRNYNVTVFEAQPHAGGMFRRCIPEYRIPISAIEKDITNLERRGIIIRKSIIIGKDLDFNDLLNDGYKAVFIASGAHNGLRLRLKGENLEGVTDTLQFLEDIKNKKLKNIPDRIVIIGGGNTAMDVASTIALAGCKDVNILYRRSAEEMPADVNEIEEAKEYGVKINYLTAPIRFIGKGNVKRVECVKMELGSPDLTGRKRPVPVANSEHVIDADQVVVAIGELPSVDFLPGKIKTNRDGTIRVNPKTMETSMKGVFAGGDVVYGPSTVSDAIISAKKAADAIDDYINKNEN